MLLILAGARAADIYTPFYPKAAALVTKMTVEQKIGQMIQADFDLVTEKGVTDPKVAEKYFLGSLLIGGDGVPNSDGNLINLDKLSYLAQVRAYLNATKDNWLALTSKFKGGLKLTLKDNSSATVGYLLGTDAVHGNQHTLGTVLFPHNLGLSNSHNESHFQNLGRWTAKGVKQSGFNYVFGPTVAVTHNPQWGRTYESMGAEPEMIYKYAKAFTRGLQGVKDGMVTGVVGSVKHFFGDGATLYGADEGDAQVLNFSTFFNRNIQGYIGAIEENIGTVMCSYSAVNGLPLAINHFGIEGLLRDDLGFKGFVISDYDEIGRIAEYTLPMANFNFGTRYLALVQIVNSGIDMLMLPSFVRNDIKDVVANMQRGLSEGLILEARIDQAVTRILAVKMAMGLVNYGEEQLAPQAHAQRILQESSEFQDAATAAKQSFVLLKNQKLLPLDPRKVKNIVLVGERIVYINRSPECELHFNYHNMGAMCGGWTVRWQGFEGNYYWSGDNGKSSNATTLLENLMTLNATLIKPNYTSTSDVPLIDEEREKYKLYLRELRKNLTAEDTVIIGVLAESPYAQFIGDVNIPYCQNASYNGTGCLWFPYTYTGERQPKTTAIEYDSFSSDVITILKEDKKNIPLLTVLLSGRPNYIAKELNRSQAFIAAFLPCVSGGYALFDAIFGNYRFRPKGFSDNMNKLAFDWPGDEKQLERFPIYPSDGSQPRLTNKLFERGYGMST